MQCTHTCHGVPLVIAAADVDGGGLSAAGASVLQIEGLRDALDAEVMSARGCSEACENRVSEIRRLCVCVVS